MMHWEQRLIDPADLGFAGGSLSEGGLGKAVSRLIADQAGSWPGLGDGILAWRAVETRPLVVEGVEILLQYNPRRILSTSARVDESSIRERACFLCSANMPVEERGLAFGDGFAVVCNPFPVLENHLVIVSKDHVPQRLTGHIGTLLDLARSLGPDYVSLYNGPACGASAPDHLHFQAGSGKALAILKEASRLSLSIKTTKTPTALATMRSYGAGFIVLRGAVQAALEGRIAKIMLAIAEVSLSNDDEPMVNLIVRHDTQGWETILIPRAQHRPAAYFAEGDRKVMVSPAAIDLGGLLVVPRESDFLELDAPAVAAIYAETTFNVEKMDSLVQMITSPGELGELQS